MKEYCCKQTRAAVELGWIRHDDRHSILTKDGWEKGVIFYIDFSPHDSGEFRLSFCPFCGEKL